MKRIFTFLFAAMAFTGVFAQESVAPNESNRETLALVEPTNMHFTCFVGETVTDTIYVTNLSSAPIYPVSGFTSDDGYIWTESVNGPIPPAPDNNVGKAVVTYTPLEAGSHNASLSMNIGGEFYDMYMTGVALEPTEQTDWVYYYGTLLEGGQYQVEIFSGEQGEYTIYYRTMIRTEDYEWGDISYWMEYTGPLTFDQPGYHRLEAYAIAPGKLPSTVIAYEFVVEEMVQYYDFEENGIYYKITGDGKVSVTSKDNYYFSYSGVVSIPSKVTHDGVTYMVTGIADDAFRYCADLTEVNIGSYVTTIGDRAFMDCTGLTSVVLGDYVISIGQDAFNGCTALTRVTLGSGLNYIGFWAFDYCPLNDIYCKAATPPVMGSYDCFDSYQMATLHVYPAVLDSYVNDENWGNFYNIVGEDIVAPAPSDVNGDGIVNIRDVTDLINQLLNGI